MLDEEEKMARILRFKASHWDIIREKGGETW